MRFAVLIAVVIAAVGCGAGSTAATAVAPTNLKITVWPEGRSEGHPTSWTLRCAPTGGTLPRRAAACQKLAELTNPFAPLRKDLACTQQYGGPQQALIAGTYSGRRVWTMLAATDGCEISRAKKLGFLVPGFGSGARA